MVLKYRETRKISHPSHETFSDIVQNPTQECHVLLEWYLTRLFSSGTFKCDDAQFNLIRISLNRWRHVRVAGGKMHQISNHLFACDNVTLTQTNVQKFGLKNFQKKGI